MTPDPAPRPLYGRGLPVIDDRNGRRGVVRKVLTNVYSEGYSYDVQFADGRVWTLSERVLKPAIDPSRNRPVLATVNGVVQDAAP